MHNTVHIVQWLGAATDECAVAVVKEALIR